MLRTLLIILVLLFCTITGNAAGGSGARIVRSSEGTEFWVCFQENSWHHALDRVGKMKFTDPRGEEIYMEDRSVPNFELFLSSDTTAHVRVEVIGARIRLDTTVAGGTIRRLRVPAAAEVTGDGTLQPNAVRITSDVPISVTCLNERGSSTDTYLALPLNALGNRYYAMSYSSTPTNDLVPHMAIVATQDSTVIKITPSALTSRQRPAGIPFSVTMRRGDVYQIAASSQQPILRSSSGGDSLPNPDLTGTLVESNKPVAVFSGHQCADVPLRVPFCNYIVEQIPPISSWGMHFILGKFARRTSYAYRVIAAYPNTKIFENSLLVKELGIGEYYENSSAGQRNIQLTATKPVLVSQYSHGYLGGLRRPDGRGNMRVDSIGDPMMLIISPTQQFLKEYRFSTPKTGFTNWQHYVNIVVPSTAVASLRRNGMPIDTNKYYPEPVGLSRYVLLQIDVPYGVHSFRADEPFGLYSYGFATNDAYGSMIGQGFEELPEIRDSLAPTFERRNLEKQINIVIRDDRSTDKGLKNITILSSNGLIATQGSAPLIRPVIDSGVPQYTMFIRPLPGVEKGTMDIQATDMAGNIATYSVNWDGRNFLGALDEKPTMKEPAPFSPWEWGAYILAWKQYHSMENISALGTVQATGNFSAESGSSAGLGLLLHYKPWQEWAFSLRAEYSSLSLIASGRDTLATQVYDTASAQYLPYQESKLLSPTVPVLTLGMQAEWQLHPLLYTFAGINSSIFLNTASHLTTTIESPLSYVFAQTGTRNLPGEQQKLQQMRTFLFSANAGIGIQKKVLPNLTIFGEAGYQYFIQSLLQQGNGNWWLGGLRFTVGIRRTIN